jgi:hypothetical protein
MYQKYGAAAGTTTPSTTRNSQSVKWLATIQRGQRFYFRRLGKIDSEAHPATVKRPRPIIHFNRVRS